ncbi:MAG: polysaccharide biosynthesis/export family protein [Bacteroidales bacterium]|nr:polysaccharide biosynthesis/export family protein [Bacteroidales bacterium]
MKNRTIYNNVSKSLLLLFVVVLMSGCYSRRANGYLQSRSSLPTYERGVYEEYRLRPYDEIVLRVISSKKDVVSLFPTVNSQGGGDSQNPFTYTIYPDGTADLPHLSKVQLAGKTLREAELYLEQMLKEFSDDVTVKLALNTSTYCVIGSARRGYFPIYKERLTIFQALAASGNIYDYADFSEVKIIRETPSGTQIKTFDIRSLSILDSEYYYIYPNDIIYVDLSGKRFWATSSYSNIIGIISSSVGFVATMTNLVLQIKQAQQSATQK